MPAKTAMRINGKLLAWAIEQGGYDEGSFAKAISTKANEITSMHVHSWIDETSPPTKPELTRIAEILRRPTALFFRRAIPGDDAQANLRVARGAAGRALQPNERVEVRWALRLQQTVSDILRKAALQATLPHAKGVAAEAAAASLREVLGRSVADQTEWDGARNAFLEWKHAIEEHGVFVLQLGLGPDGIRGFSAWDDHAPVMAVNNSADDNYETRIFSLFHELAHLARRDIAVCGRFSPENQSDEYWCDRLAAAALLPEPAVQSYVSTIKAKDDVALASKVASYFNVSLSATALRLSGLELADASVVPAVFAMINKRKRRKGGGGGSTRIENRKRQLGVPLLRLFLAEKSRGRANDVDLADLLRVERWDVDELAASLDEPVA
jgi:Zn-dependent peptidase ImmA (M78 family)